MTARAVGRLLMLWALTAVVMICPARVSVGQDVTTLGPREVTGVVVDEPGKPVAGVEVATVDSTLAKPVRTDEKGAFQISVDRDRRQGIFTRLVIARDGQARLGLARLSLYTEKVEPLRIVLRKPKEVQIQVADGSARPVENAQVYFEVDHSRFPAGSTDSAGNWSVRLPDEPRVWGVGALKGGAGYDYQRPSAPGASVRGAPPPPLPSRVTLRLTGAQESVRIRAIDHRGRPVSQVRIVVDEEGRPSLFSGITKPGQPAGGPVPELVTGIDGSLTIDWLPKWAERRLAYTGFCFDRTYVAKEQSVACDPSTGEAKLVMLPMQRVSGRIALGDGTPAAGASVQVASVTGADSGIAAITKADGKGRYRVSVRSQDAYVIYASLNDSAQIRRDAFLVTPEEPVTDIDLVITRATLVKGRVLLDRSEKAIGVAGLVAVWAYTDGLAPEVRKLLPGRPNEAHVVMISTLHRKDAEFQFLLPRGAFALRFSHRQNQSLQHHDVRISIPLFSPPLEIKRDLILSEIPAVK
jgi:hypothetical protein